MFADLWYKDAIIYSLSVESFKDSNGDGIGDFPGLTCQLDYLQGLGINAIWLMPFHPSPRRDFGYDVCDYYSVDPRFGTLGDFVEFMHACDSRGIRVLMDLVLNHTSNEHPWFRQAREHRGSPYRHWYVWTDTRPADHADGVVFPGVQKSCWSYDEIARAWYYHRFYDFQPDLDTAHPEVQAEMHRIIGFWLRLGVSGFRMDAVPFLISRKGEGAAQEPKDFELLRSLREYVQWRRGDAIVLAEANLATGEHLRYFGPDGGRLQMIFNFELNQATFHALATGSRKLLGQALTSTRARPSTSQWAVFLRNHDELDLARLSEPDRLAVFNAFAPDEASRLYQRGIRRRLAPMLRGDRRRIELAHSLMLTLPGTPVVQYGDEIGMGDAPQLPERNCCRTAMQWSEETHGGFSTAASHAPFVVAEGEFGYRRISVAAQRRDPNALLNWFERMIRMRRETREIGWGEYAEVDTGADEVLALRYDWAGTTAVFVHNLSDCTKPLALTLVCDGAPADRLTSLLDDRHSRAEEDGVHRLTIEPFGYRWYRANGPLVDGARCTL